MVDRRVCLPRWEMYVMRDKNAANIINEAVQKLLSEKSLSLAEPQYQDACSRLLGWIGEHENEVKELFPSYCTEEDRMKLLTTRAAVQMNRKVKEFQTLLKDTGVESLEQLKKLIQDAETHSSEAKQELFYGEDQDVDFDAEETKFFGEAAVTRKSLTEIFPMRNFRKSSVRSVRPENSISTRS